MLKNTVQSIFLSIGILAVFTGVCRAQSTRATYLAAVSDYRQAAASFNRDKQLYAASGSETNYNNLFASGRQTFVARQQTVLAFINYLRELARTYVTDGEQLATFERLLTTYEVNFGDIITVLSDSSEWSRADSEFASVYAKFNEAAYQIMAGIYWSELDAIVENYVTLYQNQNQRIINSAGSEVSAREKTVQLQEIEKTLSSLRTEMAELKQTAAAVNSYESYESLRARLDGVVTEVENSLKNYVKLE